MTTALLGAMWPVTVRHRTTIISNAIDVVAVTDPNSAANTREAIRSLMGVEPGFMPSAAYFVWLASCVLYSPAIRVTAMMQVTTLTRATVMFRKKNSALKVTTWIRPTDTVD